MFRALLTLCLMTATVAAQDRPVPAADAPGKFKMPPGFTATLFAGEPAVVQPIAFTFDDRGRVWVVECLSYPKWKHDGTGSDRVIVLEDTDGDGKHDVRHVVIDNGSNLSGIELGFGGIWLCSSPNLMFVQCDFNADKPTVSAKPQVVLDGWNIKDTKHNIFNSLIWGPDGWLYGLNGIQAKAKVGKPGAPDRDRVELNCGVWRYHPTKKNFEAVAHGTTNPFGLDFDLHGEMFMTNCVIKHLFHVAPGGHYDRMYGQDINPHSYGLMHSIADYIHWAGGDWTTSRGNKPEHSDAGGGHAHSGCMIYLGDSFPPEYRNTLLTCNIHGNRLNRDLLVRTGSGYKSERAPDFLFANDSWFRGIAVHHGPDGAIYVSDWCDTGECHNYDVADITNGRIHKVSFGEPKPWKGNLSRLDDAELIKLQGHKNDWFARHARRIMQERSTTAEWTTDRLKSIRAILKTEADSVTRLRLGWLCHVVGDVDVGSALLEDAASPVHRAWGIRLTIDSLADRFSTLSEQQKMAIVDSVKNKNSTAEEKLAIVSASRLLPHELRWALVENTVLGSLANHANDHNIPLMAWFAIEPIVANSTKIAAEVFAKSDLPLLREYTARRMTGLGTEKVAEVVKALNSARSDAVRADLLQGMIDGLGGAREVAAPTGWTTVSPTLLASTDRVVRDRSRVLAVAFGDESAIATMKTIIQDSNAPADDRAAAIRVLLRRGKPDLVPILHRLINEKPVRAEAIRGLAAFDEPATPSLLLKVYPLLTDAEREDAIQTLASRPTWAMQLLDAMEAGAVKRSDVSVFVARQMQGLKDKRIGERLTKVWGQIQPASAQRGALISKYKNVLTESSLEKASQSNGRAIYAKNCAACHKLYDDGGNIGPALTGAQRSSIDYILENVLDPSAVVPREYQVVVIDLNNGRRINGIVKSETEKSVTVQTSNELLVLPKSEIDSRQSSKLSMMPEGIFEKLTNQEVIDLVAYLRGRQQVPLPPMK